MDVEHMEVDEERDEQQGDEQREIRGGSGTRRKRGIGEEGEWAIRCQETFGSNWMEQMRQILFQNAAELYCLSDYLYFMTISHLKHLKYRLSDIKNANHRKSRLRLNFGRSKPKVIVDGVSSKVHNSACNTGPPSFYPQHLGSTCWTSTHPPMQVSADLRAFNAMHVRTYALKAGP